jgi:hypothetical protein
MNVEKLQSLVAKAQQTLDELHKAIDELAAPPLTELRGDGTWPFSIFIDGDDLIVKDTLITSFGGIGGGQIFDPDDSGRTASGRNTKNEEISGVALPLDTRGRTVDAGTHKALDGSPIPWLPWGILVEVKIGDFVYTPPDGLVDIGPAKRVQKPGRPKALDLTVWAARHFAPTMSPKDIARRFERRGSYRIIGGAKYAK